MSNAGVSMCGHAVSLIEPGVRPVQHRTSDAQNQRQALASAGISGGVVFGPNELQQPKPQLHAKHRHVPEPCSSSATGVDAHVSYESAADTPGRRSARRLCPLGRAAVVSGSHRRRRRRVLQVVHWRSPAGRGLPVGRRTRRLCGRTSLRPTGHDRVVDATAATVAIRSRGLPPAERSLSVQPSLVKRCWVRWWELLGGWVVRGRGRGEGCRARGRPALSRSAIRVGSGSVT